MTQLLRHALLVSVVGVGWGIEAAARADQKPVLSEKVPEHALAASFGFDPTWVLGLSYAHGWRHVIGDHDARFDVNLDAPVVLIPTGLNWRATAGVTGMFHVRPPFHIVLSGSTGVITSRDVLGTKLAWLVQIAFRPGYYVERGHFAADVSYHTVPVTRVWHSDLVKSTFEDRYPDDSYAALAEAGPFDGPYAFRSHRIRVGFTSAVQAPKVFGFFASGGFQYIPQQPGIVMNAALGTFPFYVLAGVDFRWPQR